MELILVVLVAVLFGVSCYCVLRRSLMRMVIGLMLMTQAVNLLVFLSGGLTELEAAIIPADEKVLTAPYADPLPQALVLTAIVIAFGLLAFVLALVQAAFRATGEDDVNALEESHL
jgi:multicomponent Na+:H+ antiporter subunit C